MRNLLWIPLVVLALAVACDDTSDSDSDSDSVDADSVDADSVDTGTGPDAGPAADAGTVDDGAPEGGGSEDAEALGICSAGRATGCASFCAQVQECVVLSGIAEAVGAVTSAIGFEPDEPEDCSGCIAQCEQAAGDADEGVLQCFEEMRATVSCTSSADPTVAANQIQACCDGQPDSPLCREICRAVLRNGQVSSLIPLCESLPNEARSPSCRGNCPDVAEAIVLPIRGTGNWRMERAAFADDGRIGALFSTDVPLDFDGETVTPDSGAALVVAVMGADGGLLWHQQLGQGFDSPTSGIKLPEDIAFDTAGNLYVATRLAGTADFGAGEVTAAGAADALVLSWDPAGALRWSTTLAGEGGARALGLWVGADRVLVAGLFDGELEAAGTIVQGTGPDSFFVAGLSLSGTPEWIHGHGGSGSDTAFNVVGMSGGGHAVVGIVSDGADLGDGALEVGDGTSAGFVAHYTASGELLWRQVTDAGLCYQLAPFEGDLLSQCFTTVPTELGGVSYTPGTQMLTRWDAADGTVVPFELYPDGKGFSVQQFVPHPDGGLLMTVGATPDVDLGGGVLESAGGDFMFARYDGSGRHLWSTSMGGVRSESVGGAAYSASGELTTVVNIHDVLDHGTGTLEVDGRAAAILRFAAE